MSEGEKGFVHLRVRSAYSLLEGAIKADKIGQLAAEAGMPAVALTACGLLDSCGARDAWGGGRCAYCAWAPVAPPAATARQTIIIVRRIATDLQAHPSSGTIARGGGAENAGDASPCSRERRHHDRI